MIRWFMVAWLVWVRPAQAEIMIADLSDHIISIATDFTGANLILFGTTEGALEANDALAIVVKGPRQQVVVHQHKQRYGIWLNTKPVVFDNVPSFYAYAVTSPKPLPPEIRQRLGLGANTLTFDSSRPAPTDMVPAIIASKVGQGLYVDQPLPVLFLGDRLFRARIPFPAKVATGDYSVEVHLIRNGRETEAQTIPLSVFKDGVGADIYNFSRQNSLLYGLLAISMAALAGWTASIVLRKS